jgi:SAM-dependent methyltransferase
MSKWPKVLPPLDPEQQRINDDFMQHWHEVFPSRFGFADRWNHRYVVRHAPPRFSRTLEVGAGLGEHLAWEQLSPEQERDYVALELRENMAREIHTRFPRVQVLRGNIQDGLGFSDGQFDRIVAVHVLEHLPDLPRAVREMRRLCAATGTLSVVIPCEGSFATACARRISAQRIYERRYGRPYRLFIEREHLNRPAEVAEELAACFKVEHRSFFPVPLPMEWCNLFIGMTLHPKA